MSNSKTMLRRLLGNAGAVDLALHRAANTSFNPDVFASIDIPRNSLFPWLTTNGTLTSPWYLPFKISWELLAKENISQRHFKGLKEGCNVVGILSELYAQLKTEHLLTSLS